MKSRLFCLLGFFCIFLFFSTAVFVASDDPYEYWTYGEAMYQESSGPIWGYNNTIYEFSRKTLHNETDYDNWYFLHSWDINGTLLQNLSNMDNSLFFGMTGFQNTLYTCGSKNSAGIIAKWNSNGTLIWNATFDGEGEELFSFKNILFVNDEIYTTGWNWSENAEFGKSDWLIVKWNSTGKQLWNNTWGTDGYAEHPRGVWSNGTHVFVIGDKIDEDVLKQALVVWDSEGILVNELLFENSQHFELEDLWGNENFIYTCGIDVDWRIVLIKMTHTGTVVWKKYFGFETGRIGAYKIHLDQNHVYTVGFRLFETGEQSISFTRWNFNGELDAINYFSNSYFDVMKGMWSSDEFIYISGCSLLDPSHFAYGDIDAFIVKIPIAFKNSHTQRSIPGYSIFLMMSILVLGVCTLNWRYRYK